MGSNDEFTSIVNDNIDVRTCRKSKTRQMVELANEKVEVILGGGSAPPFKQCRHSFYAKNCSPSEVESLLVRPLEQSVKVFKASGQKGMARYCAEVNRGGGVAN